MKCTHRSGMTLALWSLLLASPLCLGQKQLLWGDTHLHTSYSTDAYSNGNTTIDPATAYRYAQGQPVLHPATRQRIRIPRPLDFLVIADHAEMLQLQQRLGEGDPLWLGTASGERLAPTLPDNIRAIFGEVVQIKGGEEHPLLRDFHTPQLRQTAWQRQTALADEYNKPGEFTALIGWEWSAAPDNANLHRVVFTAAAADTASRFLPFSYYDSQRPEDLWAYLDQIQADTGADFVAIPHNSNMSDGRMFDLVDSDGRPLTAELNRKRLQWEPVVEITQVKGTSETMPDLSPNDEQAAFEVRNKLLVGGASAVSGGSYSRTALLRGLALEASTGVNPFKFGVVGSTDSHTGLSSVEEDNFLGKMVFDSLPEQRREMRGNFPAWELSASGLAGVWAESNTREAILQAFKRREVYATSGPRIALQMSAGFDEGSLLPMGSDLSSAPQGMPLQLRFDAHKDPLGADLERVQVIKGWLGADGEAHEQVIDIMVTEGGAASLKGSWSDPAFDAGALAFYYLRALEVPTSRHQVYDAIALGMDPVATGQVLEIQERAWSSPIWYTPAQPRTGIP